MIRTVVFAFVAMGASAQAQSLQLLPRAYPDTIRSIENGAVLFADGTRLEVGSLTSGATQDELLRHTSIADIFREAYPAGQPITAPARDVDPGRYRPKAFFDKMYGDCHKGEVEGKLEPVAWLPKDGHHQLLFTRVNGAAQHLREVEAEIERLPPAIRKAAYPSAGTYACRAVADSGQPSMHAYGAAIDLNLAVSDYWLWDSGKTGKITYRNRMAAEIVDIFERHGFIWGGRWYHYDTMHFEYRPEQLLH